MCICIYYVGICIARARVYAFVFVCVHGILVTSTFAVFI